MAPDPSPPLVDAETAARRVKIKRLVSIGKRVGYGLYAYAVGAFAVGAVVGFSVPLVNSIVVAMLVGSVLLIPAIVFGYGLRAAERDDRARAAEAEAKAARRASSPDGGDAS